MHQKIIIQNQSIKHGSLELMHVCNYLHTFYLNFFFKCYLPTLRLTLGHYQGDRVAQQKLISLFDQFLTRLAGA